ncbi:MAG: hypothetical protein MI723_12570, partial [Caulobacterales bacterium]|nr:hypothetical protein [Caulobacterales bacterium]
CMSPLIRGRARPAPEPVAEPAADEGVMYVAELAEILAPVELGPSEPPAAAEKDEPAASEFLPWRPKLPRVTLLPARFGAKRSAPEAAPTEAVVAVPPAVASTPAVAAAPQPAALPSLADLREPKADDPLNGRLTVLVPLQDI